MKNRKWIGIIVFFAVIFAVIFICGGKFLIYIAPKAVLTSSLTEVFSQLEARFQNDPIWILARSIDPDGKYTANMQMETDNKLLGSVDYDVILQWDLYKHQVSIDGVASTPKKEIDISVYMDPDFMAVSSEGLVNGNYYGITYDTFAEDIQKIPLIRFAVSDKLLSKWDTSVKDIQSKMNRTITQIKVPEISNADIKMLLLGILAVPCEIEETTVWLENESIDCQKLTYSTDSEDIQKILSKLSLNRTSDASVKVSFYLYQKSVVRIDTDFQSMEETIQLGIDLGENPKVNPLSIYGSETKNGKETHFSAKVDTLQGESFYTEHWDIQVTSDGNSKYTALKYSWNPNSGEMTLNINESPKQLEVNFQERENGFYLSTNTLGWLLEETIQDDGSPIVSKDTFCVMTVKKGASIQVPQYKNINQWTLEDFFVLVGGIGSLIGIDLNIFKFG